MQPRAFCWSKQARQEPDDKMLTEGPTLEQISFIAQNLGSHVTSGHQGLCQRLAGGEQQGPWVRG